MGFATKAFDLYYKRLGPTGSNAGPRSGSSGTGNFVWTGYLSTNWFNSSSAKVVSTGATFTRVSKSFLNFPEDGTIDFTTDITSGITTTIWTTTRNSASNAAHRALPWGSPAGDFLWNVLTPSWSFRDYGVVGTVGGGTYNLYNTRQWDLNYVSSSFFGREWSRQTSTTYQKGSDYGLVTASGTFTSTTASAYAVTSSWKVFDPKHLQTGGFNYLHSYAIPFDGTVVSAYPTFVNSQYTYIAADSSSYFGYDITWPVTNSTSTSSVDNQYFDQSGGAGITKTSISQSLVTGSTYATDNSATGLIYKTEALKARRLYFPVPYSGSGTTRGTDYWFKKSTGKRVDSIFYDNGGIYNVQFSLKRHIPSGHSPDTGSFMTAFIHDVIPQIPSSSNCIGGASGWYPPTNNIVTIGNQYNGTSALSFYDIQTGFYIEKFNFNLIQYGYPAQLCLEVNGSLADNAYFGIIVDEFKMCKIGVTTDPRFIKPTSIATTVIDFGQQLSLGGGDLA